MLTEKAYPALLLNADFTPFAVIPWREAVPHVIRDSAITIENYDRTISSQHKKINLPSVIALRRYVSLNRPARLTRGNIHIAFEMRCAYCGKKFASHDLNIDHVIPRSRNGKTEWSNLVLSCIAHNTEKDNKLLKELGWTLKLKPRQPTQRDILHSSLRLGIDNPQPQWKTYIDQLYWNVDLDPD